MASFNRRVRRYKAAVGGGGGGSTPIAQGLHPRLYFTAADVAGIKTANASSANYQTWIDLLNTNYASAALDTKANMADWAMNFAFAYQTYGVTGINYAGKTAVDYRDKAIACLNAGMALMTYPEYGTHGYQLAYDWLYSALTPTQRSNAVAIFATEDLPSFLSDTSNPFNSQVVFRKALSVLGALACYGDGVNDAWATAHVAKFAVWMRGTSGVTYSESQYGGNDGFFAQGLQYGGTYTADDLLVVEEAYRTAYGLSLATHYGGTSGTDDTRVLRYAPQFLSYITRPWSHNLNAAYPDGQESFVFGGHMVNQPLGVKGDSSFGASVFKIIGFHLAYYATVDASMAGLAQWYLEHRIGASLTSEQAQRKSWILNKFLHPPAVTAISPAVLGLATSREFAAGLWALRTGFASANDTLITFQSSPYLLDGSAYVQRMPGHFTIDRKGPVLVTKELLQHDYGSDGNPNFGNYLVFPDTPTDATNDLGGGRIDWTNGFQGAVSFSDATVQPTRSDKRTLLSNTGARDVDYIHVDITRAYGSTLYNAVDPARISSYIRQFVYFKEATPGTDPVRCVIFDRATTVDTRYEKRLTFNTAGTPTLNGTTSAGPTRNGGTQGRVTSTNTTLITASNTQDSADNKVWISPLLPAAVTVNKIGGPNASAVNWTTDSHEFEDVNGVNHAPSQVPTATQIPYAGAYHLEIIPTTPALTDTFLTVVEVTGAAGSQSTTTAIAGTNFTGCRVGDRLVFFGVNGDQTSGSFVLNLLAATYKVLVTNLGGATRTIAGGANLTVTDVDGGSLSGFTVGSSKAKYLQVVVSASGTGAANTVTVS